MLQEGSLSAFPRSMQPCPELNMVLFLRSVHILSLSLSLEYKQGQNTPERDHQWEAGLSHLGGLSHSRSPGSESMDGLSYL